jgi:hypothetical protein
MYPDGHDVFQVMIIKSGHEPGWGTFVSRKLTTPTNGASEGGCQQFLVGHIWFPKANDTTRIMLSFLRESIQVMMHWIRDLPIRALMIELDVLS